MYKSHLLLLKFGLDVSVVAAALPSASTSILGFAPASYITLLAPAALTLIHFSLIGYQAGIKFLKIEGKFILKKKTFGGNFVTHLLSGGGCSTAMLGTKEVQRKVAFIQTQAALSSPKNNQPCTMSLILLLYPLFLIKPCSL